jgi:hypothetical protein
MVCPLQEYYAGHGPLSEVHLTYMTFQELFVLPFSGNYMVVIILTLFWY